MDSLVDVVMLGDDCVLVAVAFLMVLLLPIVIYNLLAGGWASVHHSKVIPEENIMYVSA